jgi:hypothetical protein
MDNAENNRTAMVHLEGLFVDRDLTYDAMQGRIRCFPHVINICTGHTCSGFKKVPLSDLECVLTIPPTESINKSAYLNAVAKDPLQRAREAVRIIRASGQRRDAFAETITFGNQKGWFRSPPIKVPANELLRDVPTRWDSVYFMLNRLRSLRPVSSLACCSSDITLNL